MMSNNTYRNRRKRTITAYLVKSLVILILAAMITLMICGCIYLCEHFAKNNDEIYNNNKHDVAANPPVNLTPPDTNAEPEFCVVIDPGHGGSDGGAEIGGVAEKNINLSVALKLKAFLEKNNIKVILTRNSDEFAYLSERTNIANEANADLFISVHCNSYPDDPHITGLECYYKHGAPEGEALAKTVLDAAKSSNNINVRNTRAEDYYVLNHTNMPAVLVEMGFLTNAAERQKLNTDAYQQVIAESIANAVLKTLNN